MKGTYNGKGTRTPIKNPVKRQAGQSLRNYLNSFVDDELFFCVVPLGIACTILVTAYFPPFPRWFCWILFAVALANFAFRLSRFKRKTHRLHQGIMGEQYVAQIIERDLIPEGYRVIHDLFIEKGQRKFNIDHLLVGRNGVFCLETKTWSKPLRGRTVATYDGSKILLNGVDRCGCAVDQARALAKEAHEQILKLTGISVKVTPFIVCVGWFIEKTVVSTPDVYVVNEEGLKSFVKNCPGSLDQTDIERIYLRLMETFS